MEELFIFFCIVGVLVLVSNLLLVAYRSYRESENSSNLLDSHVGDRQAFRLAMLIGKRLSLLQNKHKYAPSLLQAKLSFIDESLEKEMEHNEDDRELVELVQERLELKQEQNEAFYEPDINVRIKQIDARFYQILKERFDVDKADLYDVLDEAKLCP